jgi:hypothetical protein
MTTVLITVSVIYSLSNGSEQRSARMTLALRLEVKTPPESVKYKVGVICPQYTGTCSFLINGSDSLYHYESAIYHKLVKVTAIERSARHRAEIYL